MKNKILILIITFLVSGCVAPDDPFSFPPPLPPQGRTDIVYIGDSNCDPGVYGGGASWAIAGISGDCISGRPLMDVNSLPNDGVSLVFVALGVNDSSPGREITPLEYGEHLTELIIFFYYYRLMIWRQI